MVHMYLTALLPKQKQKRTVHAGPSEGVFGWVAANYASGALQDYALRQGLRLRRPAKPSAPFVGVFELGGASAQVWCLTPCRLFYRAWGACSIEPGVHAHTGVPIPHQATHLSLTCTSGRCSLSAR